MNKSVLAGTLFSFITTMQCTAQQLHYNNDSLHGLSFSLQQFNQSLYRQLADSAVGWAYSIWKNGKPVFQNQGGYKIMPSDRKDGTGLAFETTTRMHVASLSKTVTALAVAKLVELKKISWDAEVKDYLPSSWKFHPLFEHLTVRALLTMKSGLDGPLDQLSSGMDSLQTLLSRGPNPAKVGIFNYQNTSYGLLRIIIAYAAGFKEFAPQLDEHIASAAISNWYKDFVNRYIFLPVGIDSTDCRMLDNEPALSYPFPYNNDPGELTGDYDLSPYAGGFGWYFSVEDAAKLINAVMYSHKIISSEILNQLFKLGFPFIIRDGKYGNYFGTGGDWGHPIKSGHWKGVHTFFYCFPDNMIVVVFTNSGEGSPSRKILSAYQNAFR